MSWRTALSLDVLLAEVNAAAPNRSKAADGSIGDTSHSARASDHNPNAAGVVRARDITNDPANGCDSSDLAERIRLLGIEGHPALGAGAYVIADGRIASSTYGWSWRTYTGSNPHDHHCHVSVSTAAAGYDSTTPWGVMAEEFDMDEKTLRKIIREELDAYTLDVGKKREWSLDRFAEAALSKLNEMPDQVAKQVNGAATKGKRNQS